VQFGEVVKIVKVVEGERQVHQVGVGDGRRAGEHGVDRCLRTAGAHRDRLRERRQRGSPRRSQARAPTARSAAASAIAGDALIPVERMPATIVNRSPAVDGRMM